MDTSTVNLDPLLVDRTTDLAIQSSTINSNTSTKFAWRFRNKKIRIFSLTCVFFCSCVASGPTNAWPTLTPLLAAEGLFGSTSNYTSPEIGNVQVIAWSMGSICALPMGLLYDSMGPAVTALVGAIFAAIGLVLMSISISIPSLNWMLYPTYSLTVTGGWFNSYSIFGFTWLFPAHQALIISMEGASLALSDSIALIAVTLHNEYDMRITTFFYIIAGCTIIAGIGGYFVAPSFSEDRYHKNIVAAKDSIGRKSFAFTDIPDSLDAIDDAVGEIEEMDELKEAKNDTTTSRTKLCFSKLRHTGLLLKDCWEAVKLNPVPCVLMQIYLCLVYMAVFYPMNTMYYYFTNMLGTDSAIGLVNAYAMIYGIGGSFCAVAGGWLTDKLGLRNSMLVFIVLQLLSMVVQLTETFAAQVVWIITWTLMFNIFIVFYIKFAIHYAPAKCFATFQGASALIMALPQIFLTVPIANQAAVDWGETSSTQYAVVYGVFDGLSILAASVLTVYWYFYPPPTAT